MSGQVAVTGAVEVLLDRGASHTPRWTVGSGFLVGRTRVLTASHNVGEGELLVRVGGTEHVATIAQVGNADQGLDLAIVDITDPSFYNALDSMVQFAELNRHSPGLLKRCWAIGFPRFKEKDLAPSGRSWLRDTAQINGEIPLGANVISGMLELHVTATPQASPYLGSSEWEGMSGAVVFTKDPVHGDYAIGVIIEHYRPEGTSSLTVIPITAISRLDEPTARVWWDLLGVGDPHRLLCLPQMVKQVDLAGAETIYRQKVVDAYKWLDFSGFDNSHLSLANVPLEEVFVRLALTVEKVIREPMPPDRSRRAEQREGQQRERVITVQEPIEVGKALGDHLLIRGEPGAGKSTLLRWLAVTFAKGQQREPDRLGMFADTDRLPVLVELGHLPDLYLKPEGGESPNWIQFLPEYLASQMAFSNIPPQLLTQALANGRCLLLFDGLDEVADRQVRIRLARSLAELARLFPGNRVVIGSRPAGVSESEGVLRPQFQLCQIERFTSDDVQRFFRFWYAQDRDLTPEQQRDAADELYARVQAAPATLQLASTPLLATILVQIWRNKGNLPERRVDLYERCCRVLVESWEASHDVAYQGVFAKMDWEDHLHLLTPLAYAIHSQEQRTSATREELVPLLAQALQSRGYTNEQKGIQDAKQFLSTLSLRSGLLQYVGDGRYGFPHLTFQEYLAARYITAQPDPEYIDLVMAHLHEAWWQQVHLLTIAHLGSGKVGASEASALILTILNVYAPPSRILRFSRNRWLRLVGPGKFLPQVQLARRIALIQAREFELATKGYMECRLDGTTAKVGTVLSKRAKKLIRPILYDEDRCEDQKALLIIAYQLLQRRDNEAIVSALLKALHDTDWVVQERAAEALGSLEIKEDTIQLRRVLVALNHCLHFLGGIGGSGSVRRYALLSIRRLLDGQTIPGYRWVPLRKRRAQLRWLKRVAFWLGIIAVVVPIGLAATRLLGVLSPNDFPLRFLVVLAGIIAFVAAVFQILGWTLRDSRAHS